MTTVTKIVNDNTAEKRRHPRFPVGITLDIDTKGQEASQCRGLIADMSASGMSFKTNAELEEGMCLYLKLDSALEIRGEVRHRHASSVGGWRRYGVRFHKIIQEN